MHHFILSIFLLNFAIADPGLTKKFIESIKFSNFTYNSKTGIVRCSIEEGIDGWLKLKPGLELQEVYTILKLNSIRYRGPTGPRLILFALDGNPMSNVFALDGNPMSNVFALDGNPMSNLTANGKPRLL